MRFNGIGNKSNISFESSILGSIQADQSMINILNLSTAQWRKCEEKKNIQFT